MRRLQLLNALGRHDEVLRRSTACARKWWRCRNRASRRKRLIPGTYVRPSSTPADEAARQSGTLGGRPGAERRDRRHQGGPRGADPGAGSSPRYNDYGPLLRSAALRRGPRPPVGLQETFKAAGDWDELGKSLCRHWPIWRTNADTPTRPSAHEQTALRYQYLTGDPADCAIGHFNLAIYLDRAGGAPESALAHRLGLRRDPLQTGIRPLPSDDSEPVSASSTSFAPDPPPVPASFAELCRIVEQTRVCGSRSYSPACRLPAPPPATRRCNGCWS